MQKGQHLDLEHSAKWQECSGCQAQLQNSWIQALCQEHNNSVTVSNDSIRVSQDICLDFLHPFTSEPSDSLNNSTWGRMTWHLHLFACPALAWEKVQAESARDIFAVQNTELCKSYICNRPSQLYEEANTGALQYYNETEWKSGNDKGSIWLAFGLFKPSCTQRCLKRVRWTCRSLFRVFQMHNHNRSQISLAKTFSRSQSRCAAERDMDRYGFLIVILCTILHVSWPWSHVLFTGPVTADSLSL